VSIRFDHVGVVTWSLRDSYRLFGECLGGKFVIGGDEEKGFRVLQLAFATSKVELMQPLSEASHLHAYLLKRGEGFHHATFICDDLEEEMERLTGSGYSLVDPELTEHPWRQVYLRPKDGFGTLIQLIDGTMPWELSEEVISSGAVTVEDVLDGRVYWKDHIVTLRDE
jgi:catechol 2,3-dioxygenase-like lactoylglutathione lyase family enzyme